MIDGRLEAVHPSRLIHGWAWDSDRPEAVLQVDLLIDGRVVVGGLRADRRRGDLQRAGIGSRGTHGFEIGLGADIAINDSIEARVVGRSEPLRRAVGFGVPSELSPPTRNTSVPANAAVPRSPTVPVPPADASEGPPGPRSQAGSGRRQGVRVLATSVEWRSVVVAAALSLLVALFVLQGVGGDSTRVPEAARIDLAPDFPRFDPPKATLRIGARVAPDPKALRLGTVTATGLSGVVAGPYEGCTRLVPSGDRKGRATIGIDGGGILLIDLRPGSSVLITPLDASGRLLGRAVLRAGPSRPPLFIESVSGRELTDFRLEVRRPVTACSVVR
ncbi:MAG: hypothetical protein JWO31_1288 [Phycisphaerales bacterium]|nr:hypothetical protein [Phycisphaerales bacterium]